MLWKEYKYLLAYLAPIAGFWGIWQGGWASPGSVYIAFFLIPALEQLLPRSAYNLSSEEETQQAKNRFFDWLLYLHIPVLYGLIAYALHTQATQDRALWELAAMWLNVGLVVGAFGINVAHELGHRPGLAEQTMAKILLLPALYMHFFIEHNRGHHKNVATGEDPASARKGEVLYAFWLRSVWGSYRNAWKLEKSEMLRFQLLQVAYLGGIWWYYQWEGLFFAIGKIRTRAAHPFLEFRPRIGANFPVRTHAAFRPPLQGNAEIPGTQALG